MQLVDIRHKPSEQDVQMYEYLKYFELDGIVVATKADKIGSNEKKRALKLISDTLGMSEDDIIIPISSLKKNGHEELLDTIEFLLEQWDEFHS